MGAHPPMHLEFSDLLFRFQFNEQQKMLPCKIPKELHLMLMGFINYLGISAHYFPRTTEIKNLCVRRITRIRSTAPSSLGATAMKHFTWMAFSEEVLSSKMELVIFRPRTKVKVKVKALLCPTFFVQCSGLGPVYAML